MLLARQDQIQAPVKLGQGVVKKLRKKEKRKRKKKKKKKSSRWQRAKDGVFLEKARRISFLGGIGIV